MRAYAISTQTLCAATKKRTLLKPVGEQRASVGGGYVRSASMPSTAAAVLAFAERADDSVNDALAPVGVLVGDGVVLGSTLARQGLAQCRALARDAVHGGMISSAGRAMDPSLSCDSCRCEDREADGEKLIHLHGTFKFLCLL